MKKGRGGRPTTLLWPDGTENGADDSDGEGNVDHRSGFAMSHASVHYCDASPCASHCQRQWRSGRSTLRTTLLGLLSWCADNYGDDTSNGIYLIEIHFTKKCKHPPYVLVVFVLSKQSSILVRGYDMYGIYKLQHLVHSCNSSIVNSWF